MRWCNTILAGALAIMLLVGWTLAQPPRGRGQQGGAGEARGQRQDPGPPRKPEDRGPGQGRGAGEGRSRNPVILALDMDGDGELPADEIANAAVALRELDRDGDGRLSREEIRPEQGTEGRGETSPAWKPKPAGKSEPGDPRKPPRAADQEGAPPAARPRTDDGKEPGAMRKATDARSADAARPGQRPASNQGPQGARPAAAGPVPGFVSIPAGEFEMGDHHGFVDPKHGGDETPVHRVRLDAFAMGIYLLDNEGRAVHRWDSQYEPGQSVYLLENGHLLHCCFTKNKGFTSGGEGGRLEEFDWEGNLVWEFEYSSDQYLSHHDIKPLPNGNILVLAVEKKSYEECLAAGFDPQMLRDQQLFPEHFIEVQPIRPKGGKIIWEWHVWDHLIQDNDASKAGFGKVAEHPELIDVNCNGRPVPAFWNHGNSIAYNAQLDQIILSARGCNEIWVIDHSTTTEEAAGHSGGRSGKGGDLLFRWGNPAAYRRGTADDRQLFQQHDAQWIPEGSPGAGHILIFNNGLDRGYSTVEEIVPSLDSDGKYVIASGKPFGPDQPVWRYQAKNPTDFYSPEISGAHRLPNGNTLICAGVRGTFFEVTPIGETVWQYVNPVVHNGILAQGEKSGLDHRGHNWNAVFKIHRYPLDYQGLVGRDLTPLGPIEQPASLAGKTGFADQAPEGAPVRGGGRDDQRRGGGEGRPKPPRRDDDR